MKFGPVITLTTDFGTADHYVATMKGVLLSRCPQARVMDISHQIEPFSIAAAAYQIDQAAVYFPARSIHVVVVDPGVGTARRPILVEAIDQYFVAPDNGVLSLILARDNKAKIRTITNRDLFLAAPSSTFHGRDIFAPLAAALGRGTKPKSVGPRIDDPVLLKQLIARKLKSGSVQGTVLSIDRFGNIITNFRTSDHPSTFTIRLGTRRITRHHATFAEAAEGQLFSYHGSSGYIEVGMNQASAAQLLQAKIGDPVTLRARLA